MPAAIVQQDTTRHQRVLIATIKDLPTLTKDKHILTPTLVIVGRMVELHDKLTWFEPAVENDLHSDNKTL